MQRKDSGVTLIELIIVLSIMLILVGAFIPSFSKIIDSTRQQTSLQSLHRITQYARTKAITQGFIVTVCGSTNGSECTKHWNNAEVLVFHDANNNHQYDEEETLYQQLNITSNTIEWRGSNRAYMRYHPRGYLLDWGRYTYCPSNKNTQHKQLVFNRMGRAYLNSPTTEELNDKGICQT